MGAVSVHDLAFARMFDDGSAPSPARVAAIFIVIGSGFK